MKEHLPDYPFVLLQVFLTSVYNDQEPPGDSKLSSPRGLFVDGKYDEQSALFYLRVCIRIAIFPFHLFLFICPGSGAREPIFVATKVRIRNPFFRRLKKRFLVSYSAAAPRRRKM